MDQVNQVVHNLQGMVKDHQITLKDAIIPFGLVFGVWFVSYVYRFCKVLMQVRGLPVIHSAVELFEAGHRSKLPNIPMITPVNALTLEDPWKKYKDHQTDLIACTQLTTPGYAVYVTASPTVAHSISSKPSTSLKPTKMFRYVAINIFGLQVASTQTGAEHRRHKNVVKGCFNEGIMETAYNGMVQSLHTMIQEEKLENGGVIADTRVMMIKLALLVIGSAGFGLEIPWTIPKTNGKTLPFEEALHVVEASLISQLLIPLWILEWFPLASVRYLGNAQRSLIHHFRAMVDSKRSEIEFTRSHLPAGEKMKSPSDILGAIVASQIDVEDESNLKTGRGGGGGRRESKIKAGLSYEEIIANIWIFIVSGHETTGHTLAWTFAHLALYPEWQDEVAKEVNDVCGDNWPNVNQLPLTLAVAYEALRLRDLVMTLPKLVSEDTLIPYTKWDALGTVTHHLHPVKAGSHLIIDSPACSRNPFEWSSPTDFDPGRWLDKRDIGYQHFTGFSSGTRVCIGKRMAEVEMIAVISVLCKEYRMSPVYQEGEAREGLIKRMMKGSEELNLQPPKFGLEFEKRV